MKILLLVGNDKLGRRFIHSINNSKYLIVIDKSSSLKRVMKLVLKRVINLSLVFKMLLAEILRKDTMLPVEFDAIHSNNELLELIKKNNVSKVVIFRGGLIINKKLLSQGIDILNIHCAKIPEYGGLGVIQRALDDQKYEQEATLYKITEKIDDGEVIATKKYTLNPKESYKFNEDLAYDTGILLFRQEFDHKNNV